MITKEMVHKQSDKNCYIVIAEITEIKQKAIAEIATTREAARAACLSELGL